MTIHGILLLDKPLGISSNAALQQAKRIFKIKKAGHTGSLDPLATGVLPLCLGEATKFSQYLLNSDKTYEVTGFFGVKTTTGDSEGDVSKEQSVSITETALTEKLADFTGVIQQIPPMYSALKFQGKPLYLLARQGQTIPRAARTITIYQLKLTCFDFPKVTFQVTCSKGTYIRVLIEDIAESLGTCAHVIALRRTQVGRYDLSKSHTLSELMNHVENPNKCLEPIESALSEFENFSVSLPEYKQLQQGQHMMAPDSLGKDRLLKLYYNNCFFGLGKTDEQGHHIMPKRLLSSEFMSHLSI